MPYTTRAQLLAVDGALVAVALMLVALVFVANWFPPIDPALDAQAIAQLYQENTNRYRFGGLLVAFSAAFFWPFGVAISEQMKRVEGYRHHPMSSLQLASVTGTVWAILFPGIIWMVAAYRPDRAPEITQVLNDMGWIIFIGTVAPGLIQLLAIGFCALNQSKDAPVFPPWFGFFNLWFATGFLAGTLVPFVTDGPFAWDGLISFWLAATFFFGWILITWYVVRQCIIQQAESLPENSGGAL